MSDLNQYEAQSLPIVRIKTKAGIKTVLGSSHVQKYACSSLSKTSSIIVPELGRNFIGDSLGKILTYLLFKPISFA